MKTKDEMIAEFIFEFKRNWETYALIRENVDEDRVIKMTMDNLNCRKTYNDEDYDLIYLWNYYQNNMLDIISICKGEL